MLTCEPGRDIAPYHSRQVVVLSREHWAEWLAPDAPNAAKRITRSPAGSFRVLPAN